MSRIVVVIWMALSALLLAGCAREDTVKIGLVAPMSGALANYGKDIANGAQLAVDELNARAFKVNGRQVKFILIVEDDKASESEGKAAANRLIDAGVVAVIGHFNSGVSIAAAPLYAQAGIPQMSVSTNPKYTRMGLATAFRIVADDIQQGQALGKFIVDELSAKSVFLVDDQTTFGRGLADEAMNVLKKTTVKLSSESIDTKSIDYPQLANKIKQSRADVVFFGGDERAGIPLLKALQKIAARARFVAGDAMCSKAMLTLAEGAADRGFYCTIPSVPSSWLSRGISFEQTYQIRFGQSVGAFSPMAFDAVHVLAEAMQRANSSDPSRYLRMLKSKPFVGKIAGAIEFDDKGDSKLATVIVYESNNGKLRERPRGAGTLEPPADTIAPLKVGNSAIVTVGSKMDVEGKLLCGIVTVALEAKGFDINDKCGTGSTQTVRNALLDGSIDLYPEYTGNAPQLIDDVTFEPGIFKGGSKGYLKAAKADLKKNKIVWLKPAPANNTYAIAITKKLAETEKLSSMADVAKYLRSGKKLKLAASQEFIDADFGLKAFERTYGFKFSRDQIVLIPGGNAAQAEMIAARGTDGVNAAMTYTTDGQISALDLISLSDPEGAVDVYQPLITIRQDTLRKYPEIKAIIEPVFATLDTETLSRLNAQLVIGGQTGAEVAEQYLRRKGFLR